MRRKDSFRTGAAGRRPRGVPGAGTQGERSIERGGRRFRLKATLRGAQPPVEWLFCREDLLGWGVVAKQPIQTRHVLASSELAGVGGVRASAQRLHQPLARLVRIGVDHDENLRHRQLPRDTAEQFAEALVEEPMADEMPDDESPVRRAKWGEEGKLGCP